ncbi:carbohydrate ABC transporter permease [Glaciihabitans sp. INWT7]|nr:carbohydrate ABC transporter permease [Glaciihabitans sp. INWT7]
MKALRNIGSYGFLLVMSAIVIIPLLSILSVALQPSGSFIAGLTWPTNPQWSNFSNAWTTGSFATLMGSSAIVALGVVPIAVGISVLAGYAFGIMKFRGSNIIFYALLIGLVMPYEATIAPLYYNLRGVGLTDNYLGVILPEIALFISFGTFWMRAFFLSTPRALVEAAKLDGATPLGILSRVLLPLATPAITTLAALFFIWSWNEFLLALVILQSPELQTAPAGLGLFVGQRSTDIQGLAAGALIITIPVIVVYIVLQRKIISGMLQGAVKG